VPKRKRAGLTGRGFVQFELANALALICLHTNHGSQVLVQVLELQIEIFARCIFHACRLVGQLQACQRNVIPERLLFWNGWHWKPMRVVCARLVLLRMFYIEYVR
jgi:hypothetical protein